MPESNFRAAVRSLAPSEFRQSIDRALAELPAFKRGALITVESEGKTVRALVAARINEQWELAGGVEKAPDLPLTSRVQVTWAG